MMKFPAALAFLALTSCVSVYGVDGELVTRGFGVVKIETSPGDAANLELKGVGVASTPYAKTIGYTELNLTTIPPETCMLMIWGDPAAWAEYLQGFEGVCIKRSE